MLNRFTTCQPALTLILWHLVYRMQLLHQPLLVRRRKPIEVGVVAQQPFLILYRKTAVLIEPVAQVSRRCSAGVRVTGACGPRIRCARSSTIPGCRPGQLVSLRLALVLLVIPALVLRSVL